MHVTNNKLDSTNPIDDRIKAFIKRHHVMTLATVSDTAPYCANLFYAYLPQSNIFVFSSNDKTRHYKEMTASNIVAASIVLETRTVGNIQGLQIQGIATLADKEELTIARSAYLKRYPYAIIADLTLWLLKPTFMKFTDNKLGFGKKLIWNE